MRRNITIGIVAAAILLAGVGLWFKIHAGSAFSDPRELLSRFPVEDAIVLNVDLAAVRKGGYLPASGGPLESEYKQFLDGTGFNYRKDLDAVVASFSKSGNFFIAQGRFNWPKLRDYAVKQGGSCYDQLCRMPGSTPQRRISFLPLNDDTIALAVSTDDLAANRLTKPGDPVRAQIPTAPVWLSVPASVLHDSGALPPGFRLTLSALANTDRIMFTIVPSGNALSVKMDATCRTAEDARILASQLRTLTDRLKDQMAGAKFEEAGIHVNGEWPFSKTLISDFTSGI